MKILNLVYSEKSDIQFKPFKFPDGQQDIVILNEKHRIFMKFSTELFDKDILPIKLNQLN